MTAQLATLFSNLSTFVTLGGAVVVLILVLTRVRGKARTTGLTGAIILIVAAILPTIVTWLVDGTVGIAMSEDSDTIMAIDGAVGLVFSIIASVGVILIGVAAMQAANAAGVINHAPNEPVGTSTRSR